MSVQAHLTMRVIGVTGQRLHGVNHMKLTTTLCVHLQQGLITHLQAELSRFQEGLSFIREQLAAPLQSLT